MKAIQAIFTNNMEIKTLQITPHTIPPSPAPNIPPTNPTIPPIIVPRIVEK